MKPINERAVVLTVAAVQFINIVDFMMVTPLGPYYGKGLGISESDFALVLSAYTGAAGVSGLLGSLFLDRFDRRPALTISLLGLVTATALGGLSTGLPSLLGTRALAGMFGGPATSLAMSIIADVVPAERRGRAMSMVMTAFSAATVLGVPAGLLLAKVSWQLPFYALGAVGFVVVPLGWHFLPPLRGHLNRAGRSSALHDLKLMFTRPLIPLSWAMTAVVMMGGFIILPNFPAYLTGNLGWPRDSIWLLYLAGGACSIITFRVVGRLVDKYGSFKVGTVASFALATQLFFYAVHFIPGTPILVMFVTFMICMNVRNVAYNTLASRVPDPDVRARFQSIQSAVQHAASAAAGALSAWILVERPEGGLIHIEWVGLVAIGFTLLSPFFLFAVERGVEGKPKPPVGTGAPSPANVR